MTDNALMPIEQKQVIFYDDEITAVLVEMAGKREIYVSLRQLCDLLGVSYQGQIRRINDDPVLARQVKGVNITFTPSGSRGGGTHRYISESQATQISQAVKAIAIALGKQTGQNEFGATWGEFYRKFGISKYRYLPISRFDEALKWLNEVYQDLTGETPF